MRNLFTQFFKASETGIRPNFLRPDSLSIVSRQSDLAKCVATLTLFLCLGVGQMWADTTYTLINQSDGTINTTDFFTGSSTTNDATGKTIADKSDLHYYIEFSSTASPGNYNTDRYIQYDVKTTSTTLYVYFYNGNSSASPCRVQEIKEGTDAFETLHDKSPKKQTSDTIRHIVTNTTNSTIYITVGSTKVVVYQVIAVESGEPLKKAGEGGYALDFVTGRVALKSGSDGKIDGIELVNGPGSNYTAASGTTYEISRNVVATKHIKFSTPATPGKLKLTWSGGQMAYNTSASATGAINITSGTEYTLSGSSTYYLINTGGAKSSLTKLEFVEDGGDCTSHSVNLSSSGSVTGGTFATSSSTVCEGSTATLTATPATGYEFTSWSATGTGCSLSSTTTNPTTLTMGTADVTVSASFSVASYTITLNNQSATTAGTESVTATYNASTNLTSAITCPTKTGYVFAGYFTGTNGTGVQLIDYAGNWIASAGGGSTYLDGSKNWKNAGALTLYACWMNYANSLDLQTYVEENVGSTAGDGTQSTDYSILSSNNYFYLLNTASSSTCLDNSDNAAYRGLKFKRSGDYVLFLVPANYSLSVKFGYVKTTKPKYSINGGAESSFSTISLASDNQSVDMGSETYVRLVKIKAADGDAAVLKTVTITADATCPDAYSFHYGPNGGDWETPICFTQVGETHEWNIANFEIPDHTNGEFWVGYAGATNGQSATKRWTDTYSSDNGAMLLLPTTGSIVGQAVGAKGTIIIWDNSGSANQYVGFKPNGYAIMYGGNNYAFSTTATANMWETNVVTLPNCTTTYQMGITTASSYTTCSHSKAAEALSAMSKTDLAGGHKKVYLDPNASIWASTGDPKYAVYDVTNSSWGVGGSDFMTDLDGDGIYEGYVADDCTQLYFARINPSDDTPSEGWNHTEYQSVSAPNTNFQNKYTIKGWSDGYGGSSSCSGPVAMSPTTGETGKFRMWDNSGNDNWYVHWIPYNVLTYDANGGSGTTAQTERNTESATTTVSVASNGFTAPTGYSFAGWNTAAGGGGDSYAAGADYTLTANGTLYAQWSPIEYTITLNKGDHGAANQSAKVDYDATALTSITHVTSTGYDLTGYYDGETKVLNADGTFAGTNVSGYITSSKWTKASDCTLTAKWTAKTTTVTLNANTDNHGSGDNQTVTATYDAALPPFTHTSAETGYHLIGYYTGATSGDKIINADGTYNANSGIWNRTDGATLTLYAHYEINTYTITFVSNNDDYGSVSPTSIASVNHGSEVSILSNVLTLKETDVTATAEDATAAYTYAFDSWSVSDGAEITEAQTITATFTRTANSYDVTHSFTNASRSSGGSGGTKAATYGTDYTVVVAATSGYALPSSITVTIGEDEATEDTEYTWDKSTGTVTIGGSYILGDIEIEITADPDVTTYSVTYAAGVTLTSGDVPTDSNSPYDSGAEVTVLGNTGSMVYSGYTFRGWTSGDYFYKAGDKFTISANTTLTAVWDDGASGGSYTYTFESSQPGNPLGTYFDVTTSAVSGHTYEITGSLNSNNIKASDLTGGGSYFLGGTISTSEVSATYKTKASYTKIDSIAFYENASDNGKPSYVFKVVDASTGTAQYTSSTLDHKTIKGSNGTNTWTGRYRLDLHSSPKTGKIQIEVTSGSSGKYYALDNITVYYKGDKSYFTVSFANQTGFGGSTTLPSNIVGVPNGKKIVQPADPTAVGYEFDGWYSDAACTAGNEIDWSTMTVTADKTIYAKWCANHTVAWVVNGSAYSTGTPTTATTDCDGITTMPTAPADNTLSGCANSFRGWSATNLYGEATNTQPTDLFVTAANAPTIDADKTFYAVFGTATDAAKVGTVLWSEDWTGESADAKPSGPTSKGSVVYGEAIISYSYSDGTGDYSTGATKIYNDNNAGGLKPELMVHGNKTTAGYYEITGLRKEGALALTLTFKRTNSTTNALSLSVAGEGYSISKVSGSGAGTYVYTITCGSAETFTLRFTGHQVSSPSNTRIDDIVVKVKTDGATNYRCICPTMTVTPKLVTASTPIFITSAANKTVRSQDSLLIVGSGLSKSTALTLSTTNGSFALKSRTNGVISTDATGSIDTVAYIYYTPGAGDTSDGLDKNANFTVSVDGNGAKDVTVSQALIGRHVPANFVIAAKVEDKWYALPSNMSNASSNPIPVEITVDNDDNPTSVTTNQLNVYSLYGQTNAVINGGNGQYVKLAMLGQANAPLFGQSSSSTIGKSGTAIVTNDLSAGWWWKFVQYNTSITDPEDAKYRIYGANNPTKHLYIQSGKWGQYASGVDELRLIPWTCSDPGAPTISGETTYAVGETISLTATCASGADEGTSYTWYKGADWATASEADPVQAAAFGSSGYTLTIADCVAGDAGTYWCEASNGSGCEAHNATGYTIDVPLGAHTLTWEPNVNTAESSIGTSSKNSTTSLIDKTSDMSNISNYGSLTITSSAKTDLTSKIEAPSTYAEGKYMYVTFTVPSGYSFTPSAVSIKVQPVSAAGDVKLILSDASGHSINKTQSDCSQGNITMVTMNNAGGTYFVGTVTLKMYCYGSSTGTYRLGSSITIDGTLEELSGYLVTYNGNGSTGGSVPVDASSPYDAGATVTVLGNTGSLAKNGYEFDNWNTTAEGDGTPYKEDDTFTMPGEDVVLYAQWTPNTYTITYNLNGASWASSAGVAEYTVGTGATLPLAGAMTNTGYTFGGWYDNSGLTGSAVTEITTSDYGNKEFWAKWTENTYTITYNANGGSGSTSPTVGHYVTVADNGFTAPSGKTFIEWNTLSTGLGSSYNEGDEIELTANMNLYAIWGKSVGTINWTVTKIDSKLYRGGGGYTIKAEIDDASWDASDADSSKLVLTASEGVVLRNIAKSINAFSKAQITANFDITTDVNANATKITFTLTVPENNGYAPLADDHDENLDNCTGGKVEVRFLSSNKNDAGENFADMSTSSNTTQLVGDGFAKLIAIGSAGLNLANNKIGYRHDGRLDVVFKLTGTTTLDILFNANSTGKTFELYSFSSAKDLSDIATSDYSSKTKVTSGITVTGAAFEQGKSKSTSAGAGSVSSGTVTLTTTGGIKATYASLASGYYVYHVSSSGNEGYLYGFDADAGGGGGGAVSPTLTWDTDLSGGVAAETGDADFTHTVTQNKNSLGAITYSSSNTSVATVNATTGKVHIVGGGSATITATMAESGCYEEATASYDISVTDNCDDVAGTIEVVDLGCSGIQMTVTGHTGEGAGATYQWYKDDVDIGGATNITYTATAAGSYYVIVTNTGEGHCSMASTNTVTVTAKETATATKIVDEWYVKNGRRTPDIALVQTENADNFQVKSGSTVIWDTKTSVTTGFAGCSFYLGTNGIIYLMGQKPDGTEPSGLTAGDETLTFIAKSCGGDASVLDIKIHKQAATDYKTVAFVVDGTKEGAWNAVTSGHADGTMLYEYLDSVGTAAGERKFMLYERNIYKTTNEDTLRQHYSQFDAILITDDPNTRTVPDGIKGDDAYKTKGYVNAMGALIDVRPILTMEAYVSALANWKAKGIDGNPSSPNPRQYAMKLDCKNHAIFVGIDPSSTNVEVEDIDGVEYWTVAMVDSTKSPYSGVAYNVDTKDKPALQGFSASDVSGLMLLGEISDGALYAGVERQEEAAARLLLLGLNNKALPNALTPEGKKIIENTLKYLIETDMEKVDDCSNYFIGGTEDHETDWNIATNWSKGIVPNSPYVKARILKPCVLSGLATKVSRVDIATSGKSMHLPSGECSGSLTIEPTGALIVAGAVRSAIAPYFNTGDLMPTQATDLTINTSADNQACVILNNDKGDTEATVNLYSLGRKDANYQYQYFAIPMESLPVNPTFANETHGGTKIYTYVWEEGTSSWTRRKYYDDLYAFEGLGITTNTTSGYMDYTMAGNLASTAERDITLTKDGAGNNIIGNSYTAPINIASLVTAFEDDDKVVKTVYIYSTGRDPDKGTGSSNTTETAGQWLAIPMEAAAYEAWGGLKVIPSMQAFLIQVTAETGMTLDYKAMVRSNKAGYNEKLRAPQRFADEPAVTLTRLRVADTQTHTDLYLFEAEQFSEAFDNGWEATYMEGDGRSAKLCAETEIGQMAVAALEEIEGTVLNFAPGQEMTYTFTFSGAENGYYLNDLKLRTSTLISEENSYEFTYEEGDTNRFYISRTPINTPAINTGTDDTRDRVKARKILYNNKLYILLNGRVYSAEGAIVK